MFVEKIISDCAAEDCTPLLKPLMGVSRAIKTAQTTVGKIHRRGQFDWMFYTPFDPLKPCGASTEVKALHYARAQQLRKLDLLEQTLLELGYNQHFSSEVQYTVTSQGEEFELSLLELVKKYHTGVTPENCLNDCLDFNNISRD